MKSNRKSVPKKKANVKQKKPITNPRKTLEKKVAKRLKPEFPNNFHFPNQFFCCGYTFREHSSPVREFKIPARWKKSLVWGKYDKLYIFTIDDINV